VQTPASGQQLALGLLDDDDDDDSPAAAAVSDSMWRFRARVIECRMKTTMKRPTSSLLGLLLLAPLESAVGCGGDGSTIEGSTTSTGEAATTTQGVPTTTATVTTTGADTSTTAAATEDTGAEETASETSGEIPVPPDCEEPAPSGADPVAPAEFYGLSGSLWNSPLEWDEMAKTGARTVRMHLNWPGLQTNVECTEKAPEAPNYNWKETDNRVRLAAERGVRFLPVVYGNACGDNHAFPDLATGPEYPQWLNFVDALVRRYGHNGAFWAENPDLTALPMTTWEIWNEENYAINNPDETISPRKYARFLVDTAARLRTAQAEISETPPVIVLGGLVSFKDATPIGEYFDTIINTPPPPDNVYYYTPEQFKNAFDGVGYHPYALAGDAAKATDQIIDVDQTLTAYSIGDKSIWLTEMGWPVGTFPWGMGGTDLVISPVMQKHYLQDSMDWLESNYESLNIKLVAWYNYQDFKSDLWDGSAGLRDVDGRKRPSWCAFTSYASAPKCPKMPYVLTNPDVDRSTGSIAMLMAFINEGEGISVVEFKPTTGFLQSDLPGSDATVGTNASVTTDAGTGRATVVYRQKDGQIGVWERSDYCADWSLRTLGSAGEIADGVTPGLARSGTQADGDLTNSLVYRNAGGGLSFWAESPDTGWIGPFDLGHSVAAYTSPTIVREPVEGITEIAYQTAEGKIGLTTWTPAFGWTNATFGIAGSVGTSASPDVARDPETGLVVIPYRNQSDQLAVWYLPIGSLSWSHDVLDGAMAPWANPSVAIGAGSGETFIPFPNGTGGASVWRRDSGGSWSGPSELGGDVAFNSNLSISVIRTGETDNTVIPYVDAKYGLEDLQLGVLMNLGVDWLPPVFW
jgi:hypothetical protein